MIYPTRLASMKFQPDSPPARVATDQADKKQNLVSSHDTMDQTHHSNLVKLDLSDGQHLYAKLVVNDDSSSNISPMLDLGRLSREFKHQQDLC